MSSTVLGSGKTEMNVTISLSSGSLHSSKQRQAKSEFKNIYINISDVISAVGNNRSE